LALQGNLEGACVAGWFSSAVYICCLADETSNGLKLRNDKCRPLMLGLLPRSIADKVYHWIAAHRYKWFGKRATCFVPRRGREPAQLPLSDR
jgi:hypothetical protein